MGGSEHVYHTMYGRMRKEYVCIFVCILVKKVAHENAKCCVEKQGYSGCETAEMPINTRKIPQSLGLRDSIDLVEAGGVEPPSENNLTTVSPGADGYLHSLTVTEAVILHGLVAS